MESSVPWEKTSFFLVQWDLTFKQILVTKPKKPSSSSVRASKCYLNEEHLIYSRVMATISNLVHRFLKHTLAGCPNGASRQMSYIILGVYEKFSREFHQ